MPVWKKDKESVRVRGNFKLTVNKVARLDRYPIPRIEDLLAKLAGGKRFSKLDMSQAYQELLLDESSRQYVVINTHKGLFRYSRLPFGVSSASGIFQRVMKNLLQDIAKLWYALRVHIQFGFVTLKSAWSIFKELPVSRQQGLHWMAGEHVNCLPVQLDSS